MGCETVGCETYDSDRKLKVASNAAGDGGIALNDNFRELQYRQPKCNYEGSNAPTSNDSSSSDFCVGSRWLQTNAGPGNDEDKMWICVDDSPGAAVWVPWFRWEGDWDSTDPAVPTLATDNHFGVDGEIRRISSSSAAPLILVPKGTGAWQGDSDGNLRGENAVDFQVTRTTSTQVASGDRAFIAAGQNNEADGDDSHAEGCFTKAKGKCSHAEGFYAQTNNWGEGAHAEGHAPPLGRYLPVTLVRTREVVHMARVAKSKLVWVPESYQGRITGASVHLG